MIDAGGEAEPVQIFTGQVTDRRKVCQIIIGGGDITLSLHRHAVVFVYRAGLGDARFTRNRSSWTNTKVSGDGSGARIRYCLATQHGKGIGRSQNRTTPRVGR